MATYSTNLGLKLNAQSDPFALADFIANWEILDGAPGIFICTSTSRPALTSSQAGRIIFMSDLKQLSYWTGTAWSDLRDSAPVFGGGAYLNAAINPNAQPTFNVLTFITPRPSALAIWAEATYTYPNNKTQDAYQQVVLDGANVGLGAYREQIRFAGNSGDSGNPSGANAVSMAIVPVVNPGQHTVGMKVQNGTYPVAITLVGVKIMGMMALFASNNVL